MTTLVQWGMAATGGSGGSPRWPFLIVFIVIFVGLWALEVACRS